MQNEFFPRRRTAAAIVATAALFPIIVVVLNLVQRGGYSPIRQAISELALGTGGNFMVAAFCSLGVSVFLVGRLLRHTVARARVAPILLSIASVFAGPMSAAFHTDRAGAKATWHGNVHSLAGIAAFLLILAAMTACSYRFHKDAAWRSFALPTTVWTVIGIVTFVLIAALGNAHFGVAQRLFVGTFVAWIIHTGLFALRDTAPAVTASSASSRAESALVPNRPR